MLYIGRAGSWGAVSPGSVATLTAARCKRQGSRPPVESTLELLQSAAAVPPRFSGPIPHIAHQVDRGSEFLRRAGLPRSARRPVATSAGTTAGIASTGWSRAICSPFWLCWACCAPSKKQPPRGCRRSHGPSTSPRCDRCCQGSGAHAAVLFVP